MQQNDSPRRPARRFLRLVLIVALFAVAAMAANSGALRQWWGAHVGDDRAEADPVTVYPYNFTQQGVEYAIGAALLAYLPPGAADGHTVLKQGYVPPSNDAPLPVRWRYLNRDQAGAQQARDYPFSATLALPRRPSKDAVLVLRFYPDGKVAARYTTQPEVAQSGNVAQALPGDGWVSNR